MNKIIEHNEEFLNINLFDLVDLKSTYIRDIEVAESHVKFLNKGLTDVNVAIKRECCRVGHKWKDSTLSTKECRICNFVEINSNFNSEEML